MVTGPKMSVRRWELPCSPDIRGLVAPSGGGAGVASDQRWQLSEPRRHDKQFCWRRPTATKQWSTFDLVVCWILGRTAVRAGLYMATLAATRFNQQVSSYLQALRRRGKSFKVAMVEGRKAVYVRIYSGTLKAGEDVFNPRLGPPTKEREKRPAHPATADGPQKPLGRLGIGQHRRQRLVQLMGHTGGQLAQRVEPGDRKSVV